MRPQTWYSALVDVKMVTRAKSALAPYKSASPDSGEMAFTRSKARRHAAVRPLGHVGIVVEEAVGMGVSKASHTGPSVAANPARS